ncbi:hypothetical protein B0I35DRAFT_419002 [Stachybotrys elegans]|uniref:Uncharacterized protein n=1 Tax=Stachybotrys elegans TaxID=80388 RepID=A0A8K0T1Y5_9HYPO|nr:hypothetical protein B0I35DRAFT_419002 [Stachybotrys elegans]
MAYSGDFYLGVTKGGQEAAGGRFIISIWQKRRQEMAGQAGLGLAEDEISTNWTCKVVGRRMTRRRNDAAQDAGKAHDVHHGVSQLILVHNCEERRIQERHRESPRAIF